MLVAHDWRLHEVAEYVARHQRRQCNGKVLHIGQAASEDDDVRIEQIDHLGHPTCEPVGVAIQRRLRARFTGGGAGGDTRRIMHIRTVAISGQRRSGDPSFQATPVAAPALWSWYLIQARPGQRVMAPLAGDTITAT